MRRRSSVCSSKTTMIKLRTYEGGCHCERVRFRVTADLDTGVLPIGAVWGYSGNAASLLLNTMPCPLLG